MASQKTTERIAAAVEARRPFAYGNITGEWKVKNSFSGNVSARMWEVFADVLKKHSNVSGMFVLFSYATPVAWYIETEGKWYLPNMTYSATSAKHMSAIRYALRGQNVVTLSLDESGNVTETEHEFYVDKK